MDSTKCPDFFVYLTLLKEHVFVLSLILYSDVSDMGLGTVLQPHEDGKHSTFYLRKKIISKKAKV